MIDLFRKNFSILFCALAVASLVSCSKSTVKTDWEEMNLKGDVKSYWEREYTAYAGESGKAEKDRLVKSIKFTFSKNGYLSEVDWFDSDADTIQKVVSEFDETGRPIKKRRYDEFGRLSSCSYFTYDEKDRLLNTEYRDADEATLMVETTEYNDENLIETTTQTVPRHGENVVTQRVIRQMSKDGLPKETRVYNEEKELINYRKETYDSNQQLVAFKVYASDELTEILSVQLEYDQWGNVTKQQASEEYKTQTYKYIFDNKKNWTSLATYGDGEVQGLTEREIEYY